MLAKLLPILLFVASASATTDTYLVYRANFFPQDRYLTTLSPMEYKYFVDTGKKNITNDGVDGQPFRLTSYEVNYDGKYAIWTVTGNEEEKSHIATMLRKGFIVLLSSTNVVETEQGPRGKVKEAVYSGQLAELPSDYYEVAISSSN